MRHRYVARALTTNGDLSHSYPSIISVLSSPNSDLTPQQLLPDPTLTTNPKIKTYLDTTPHSGNTISRVFCADCGSRLWIMSPKRPGFILVHVAVLDVEFNLAGEWRSWKPDREIWCRWKEEWLDVVGAGEVERFHMGS